MAISSPPRLEAQHIDRGIEKRILRKLDWQVVPVLWFLFLVSFVDRGNIGNAKIQGMDQDLKLTGNKYNIAVMVFTLAYVLCGIPANLVFKKTGPRSLGVMMFFWGVCAIGQGLTKSFAGLVTARLHMGVFESGFVPGCAYLLGSYYTNDEFLRRYAVFFSAAIIAGAFNGLFATLLAMADGAAGLRGWRWIFIVEGLITTCVAIAAFFLIIDFPEKTKMFDADEKAVLLARLKQDKHSNPGGRDDDDLSKHIVAALKDWKIWLAMLAYLGAEENASAVVAFQPTVLKGLGYTSTQAQIHSIPIYSMAFAVSLISAWLSAHVHHRYPFALFGGLLTLAGLVLELSHHASVGARYGGMFLITTGAYVLMPIVVVWNAGNVPQGYKRTVAFGMVIAVGNAGALISSNVFLSSQAPRYRTGFSVGLAMDCLAVACVTGLCVGLWVKNRALARKEASGAPAGWEEEVGGEKLSGLRYQL